ncbi:hypothetical protein [Kitasatospora sp. NPDC001175]|uniref:hypothetical protein n=1 Tax=Kitasatospora sp. NPDC001175 TaxID=3157103 RepID=UPI003D0265D5
MELLLFPERSARPPTGDLNVTTTLTSGISKAKAREPNEVPAQGIEQPLKRQIIWKTGELMWFSPSD